jgi:hypothetical protein
MNKQREVYKLDLGPISRFLVSVSKFKFVFVFLARIMAGVSQKEKDAMEIADRLDELCLGDVRLATMHAKKLVDATISARNDAQAEALESNTKANLFNCTQTVANNDYLAFVKVTEALASAQRAVRILQDRQISVYGEVVPDPDPESKTPSSPLEYFEFVMTKALEAEKEWQTLKVQAAEARLAALKSGVGVVELEASLEAFADRVRETQAE